jgi:hypothetical protein
MSQFTAEQKELLQKWKEVARRYERSIHFDFNKEYYNESIIELKRSIERFLDDPKEETFNDFWDRSWAA